MGTCNQCGRECPQTFEGACRSCSIDSYDYDENDCANCGGEGFTYGCGWDWQCDTYDEGEGTCLCTRRCEWCHQPTEAEMAERQRLRELLATPPPAAEEPGR